MNIVTALLVFIILFNVVAIVLNIVNLNAILDKQEKDSKFKDDYDDYMHGVDCGYDMGQLDIIHKMRHEIDKIYEKYEGHELIEKEDIMEGFEDIICDYYESK